METDRAKTAEDAGRGARFLHELRRGAMAEVLALHGETDAVVRLQALGVLPGREVRHCHTAPLGDPVAYEVGGQKISMRKTEARMVEIRLCHGKGFGS
jgi:Fe2+ transport system protein FeoA